MSGTLPAQPICLSFLTWKKLSAIKTKVGQLSLQFKLVSAKRFHLTNVIDVVEPNLKTMGFHFQKEIEVPIQIVLSYE